MFDLDKNWKQIKDVSYYGTMSTPQGSQKSLDQRVISLFSIYNIPIAKEATVLSIYQSILRGHLLNFPTELLPISDKLIEITLKLLKVKHFTFLFASMCVLLNKTKRKYNLVGWENRKRSDYKNVTFLYNHVFHSYQHFIT